MAEEGQGPLVELRRVANVGRDDLLEGKVGSSLVQLGPELLRLDGELAADSVLGCLDMRVDVVVVEPPGWCGRHGSLLLGHKQPLLLQLLVVWSQESVLLLR